MVVKTSTNLARSIYWIMQSMPDGQNRFVMNYQDHLTNLCVKEPLTSKRATDVAYTLPNSVFLVNILEF